MGHATVIVKIGFVGLADEAVGTAVLEVDPEDTPHDVGIAVGKAIEQAKHNAREHLNAVTVLMHLARAAYEDKDEEEETKDE
jgi:predicted alternative tryptophan synthase beta-subunit